MEKLREMNRGIFKDNLIKTIEEIKDELGMELQELKFKIVVVHEPNKPLNARDDSMRLVALSEKNVGTRLLSLDEVSTLLSCNAPFVPIWIDVSLFQFKENETIFKLETSLRFRKPSLLRNVETGHAPFRAIINPK